MKDNPSGPAGTQDIDTKGTGTDLTALPQRRSAPTIIEAQDSRLILELKQIGIFPKLSTMPDVQNNEHWEANNIAATSITDFANAQDGQHLYILGDGFTTVMHSANIINVSGVDILLDAGVIYHYVSFDGVWYQICCSDGGGGGGAVAWVDITGKPATFPPDYSGFPPSWTDISGVPSTFPPDYVSYPPSWGIITGKPAVFPPDLSAVNLGDLANVDTTGAVATMFLRYDGAGWIAESVAFSSSLAGLSDVNIPGPTNNQVLTYNNASSKWIAQTPTASGDVFLAANNVFTGNNQMTGINLQSGFPVVVYRDTDLAVNAGGLWYVTAANGGFQVLKNTAAAGDFSTYDTVIAAGAGVQFSTNALSMVLGNATAANPCIQVDTTYTLLYGPHATTPCHLYVGSNADPAIYLDADNVWFRTQGGTNSARLQRTGTTVNFFHLGTTGHCGTASNPFDTMNVNTGYNFNATKVVGARVTGWNAPTGTLTRGTFAVSGATTASTAQALAALITDLRTHGLIGT